MTSLTDIMPNAINPETFEREHVHQVYDQISTRFNQTRAYIWPSVAKFLRSLPKGAQVGEGGCGNGKNLIECGKLGLSAVGCDMSDGLLEVCRNKKLSVVKACVTRLPWKSGSFDAFLSVAVLHHLSTQERRERAVREILRVLKLGGKAFIQVWALEQPADARRKFTTQDNLVSFRKGGPRRESDPPKRFYHVFKKGELEDLVKTTVQNVKIVESFYEVGNWGVVIEKLNQLNEYSI